MHRSDFLKEVKGAFPCLVDDLNDQGGLLYMEVSVFCDYTQRNIDEGNRNEVVKCFDMAKRFYLKGNQDLKNAIGLSYVRDLNLSDSKKTRRSWARDLLSDQLLGIYRDFITSDCDPKSTYYS